MYDQHPQVFSVDSSGVPQPSAWPAWPAATVPHWSFPPAQERLRSRGRRRGCMGASPCLLVVLLLLFLVFAALGLGALQIYKLQRDLTIISQNRENEFYTPEKQVDVKEQTNVPAAHVLGRIHNNPSHKTLLWEPQAGCAFTRGGVVYRPEDGALQVNHTGLYHIYSRVEVQLLRRLCPSADVVIHTVFVRRAIDSTVSKLMVGQKAVTCSQTQDHACIVSYLGSALQLQKMDRVYVNVSHPTYLSHQHYANFFGVYKISGSS